MYSTTAPSERKPGPLINRNFAWLWLGGTVSSFGDIIYDFTLIVWITLFLAAHQTWAPLAVSGVLVASLGTMFICAPLAGVFADRWNKRRTMLWMDALRVVLVALLIPATNAFPLPFLPDGRLPVAAQLVTIYIIVFLATLCGQFFNPAKTTLIGDIVPDAYRARASGWSQASMSISLLLGPALAPVLALTFGVEWAIAINAASFAFSFLTIALIRVPQGIDVRPQGRKSSALRELGAGVKLAAGNRVLSTTILAATVVMLGAATINTLDIFFALHNLHVTPKLYGLLSTTMGVGLLVGAILAGTLAERVGLVRLFTLSLLVAGVLLIAYSRMTSFVPALILICLIGICQAALNTAVLPLFLRVTPREFVGRVSTIVSSVTAMAQLIGTILTGYLAGQTLASFRQVALGMHFGPFDIIIGSGGVIVVLGALFAIIRLGFKDPTPSPGEPQPVEPEPVRRPAEVQPA
jgi:MFS family permease